MQCTELARNTEHFCTFIHSDKAAVVIMVHLVGGSHREVISIVGVISGHQERNPEVAVSFCPVAFCSMCLLTAWFVPYIAVSGGHRKKTSGSAPRSLWSS